MTDEELGAEKFEDSHLPELTAMKEHPWTFSLGQLADMVGGGVKFTDEIVAREVGPQRFEGARGLPFRSFPVTEMAIFGYEELGCWTAKSVFAVQQPDGPWKVVGYAYWGEQDRPDRTRKRASTPERIHIDGLRMPWPNFKFGKDGYCGAENSE